VSAESYQPGAVDHNVENIGLEPVWPYNLIGDTSPLFALARRTYEHRAFQISADWAYDPIQAARLGMGSEVGATLNAMAQKFQKFPNGLAKWEAADHEFYVEETGITADALEEALVQDYDGTIRIAPALPPGWDFDGTVAVRGKTRVNVQTRNGAVTTAVIDAGKTGTLRVRNPWAGQEVDVVRGKDGVKAVKAERGPVITFRADAGESYLVEKHGAPAEKRAFAPVSGTLAGSAKRLGTVQIGLFGDGQ
jgi:hypothetical protein